jgi:hypothetical protein
MLRFCRRFREHPFGWSVSERVKRFDRKLWHGRRTGVGDGLMADGQLIGNLPGWFRCGNVLLHAWNCSYGRRLGRDCRDRLGRRRRRGFLNS